MSKFLWVEGIDFGEHIDDTNQLSIIRGSSLALSEMGSAFQGSGDALFTGSSSALFASEQSSLPLKSCDAFQALKNMRFAFGQGEDGDEKKAILSALARARFGQITGDFARKPLASTESMCALSRSLPGDGETGRLTKDQIERLNIGTDRTERSIRISSSAKDRRKYGQKARQDYLAKTLKKTDLAFTTDLHQLSDPTEAMGDMPLSVQRRIALFYTDGNSFSKIRKEKLDGTAASLAAFSNSVNDVILHKALKQIITHLEDGKSDERNGTAFHKKKDDQIEHRLRFEILICGGDEFCFIAPAWLGLKLANIFMEAIEDAKHDKEPLHFKAGLVFANCKTPIKPLRGAAMDLADRCRPQDGKNSIGIHAFESIQPTAYGFNAIRDMIFGEADERATDPGSLSHDGLTEIIKTIKNLKDNKFPRSQIQKTIRAARWNLKRSVGGIRQTPAEFLEKPNLLTSDDAKDAAKAWVEGYKGPNSALFKDAFPDGCDYAVRAWQLAHVWDYVWEPPGETSKSEEKS